MNKITRDATLSPRYIQTDSQSSSPVPASPVKQCSKIDRIAQTLLPSKGVEILCKENRVLERPEKRRLKHLLNYLWEINDKRNTSLPSARLSAATLIVAVIQRLGTRILYGKYPISHFYGHIGSAASYTYFPQNFHDLDNLIISQVVIHEDQFESEAHLIRELNAIMNDYFHTQSCLFSKVKDSLLTKRHLFKNPLHSLKDLKATRLAVIGIGGLELKFAIQFKIIPKSGKPYLLEPFASYSADVKGDYCIDLTSWVNGRLDDLKGEFSKPEDPFFDLSDWPKIKVAGLLGESQDHRKDMLGHVKAFSRKHPLDLVFHDLRAHVQQTDEYTEDKFLRFLNKMFVNDAKTTLSCMQKLWEAFKIEGYEERIQKNLKDFTDQDFIFWYLNLYVISQDECEKKKIADTIAKRLIPEVRVNSDELCQWLFNVCRPEEVSPQFSSGLLYLGTKVYRLFVPAKIEDCPSPFPFEKECALRLNLQVHSSETTSCEEEMNQSLPSKVDDHREAFIRLLKEMTYEKKQIPRSTLQELFRKFKIEAAGFFEEQMAPLMQDELLSLNLVSLRARLGEDVCLNKRVWIQKLGQATCVKKASVILQDGSQLLILPSKQLQELFSKESGASREERIAFASLAPKLMSLHLARQFALTLLFEDKELFDETSLEEFLKSTMCQVAEDCFVSSFGEEGLAFLEKHFLISRNSVEDLQKFIRYARHAHDPLYHQWIIIALAELAKLSEEKSALVASLLIHMKILLNHVDSKDDARAFFTCLLKGILPGSEGAFLEDDPAVYLATMPDEAFKWVSYHLWNEEKKTVTLLKIAPHFATVKALVELIFPLLPKQLGEAHLPLLMAFSNHHLEAKTKAIDFLLHKNIDPQILREKTFIAHFQALCLDDTMDPTTLRSLLKRHKALLNDQVLGQLYEKLMQTKEWVAILQEGQRYIRLDHVKEHICKGLQASTYTQLLHLLRKTPQVPQHLIVERLLSFDVSSVELFDLHPCVLDKENLLKECLKRCKEDEIYSILLKIPHRMTFALPSEIITKVQRVLQKSDHNKLFDLLKKESRSLEKWVIEALLATNVDIVHLWKTIKGLPITDESKIVVLKHSLQAPNAIMIDFVEHLEDDLSHPEIITLLRTHLEKPRDGLLSVYMRLGKLAKMESEICTKISSWWLDSPEGIAAHQCLPFVTEKTVLAFVHKCVKADLGLIAWTSLRSHMAIPNIAVEGVITLFTVNTRGFWMHEVLMRAMETNLSIDPSLFLVFAERTLEQIREKDTATLAFKIFSFEPLLCYIENKREPFYSNVWLWCVDSIIQNYKKDPNAKEYLTLIHSMIRILPPLYEETRAKELVTLLKIAKDNMTTEISLTLWGKLCQILPPYDDFDFLKCDIIYTSALQMMCLHDHQQQKHLGSSLGPLSNLATNLAKKGHLDLETRAGFIHALMSHSMNFECVLSIFASRLNNVEEQFFLALRIVKWIVECYIEKQRILPSRYLEAFLKECGFLHEYSWREPASLNIHEFLLILIHVGVLQGDIQFVERVLEFSKHVKSDRTQLELALYQDAFDSIRPFEEFKDLARKIITVCKKQMEIDQVTKMQAQLAASPMRSFPLDFAASSAVTEAGLSIVLELAEAFSRLRHAYSSGTSMGEPYKALMQSYRQISKAKESDIQSGKKDWMMRSACYLMLSVLSPISYRYAVWKEHLSASVTSLSELIETVNAKYQIWLKDVPNSNRDEASGVH